MSYSTCGLCSVVFCAFFLTIPCVIIGGPLLAESFKSQTVNATCISSKYHVATCTECSYIDQNGQCTYYKEVDCSYWQSCFIIFELKDASCCLLRKYEISQKYTMSYSQMSQTCFDDSSHQSNYFITGVFFLSLGGLIMVVGIIIYFWT